MKYRVYFEIIEDAGPDRFNVEASYALFDDNPAATYSEAAETVSAAHRKLAEFRRDFREQVKNHKVVIIN